jgi:hypothetical protein
MPRKPAVVDREVLALKLKAVDPYIRSLERALSDLNSQNVLAYLSMTQPDVYKAVLAVNPGRRTDADELLPDSLIRADLERVAVQINPDHAAVKLKQDSEALALSGKMLDAPAGGASPEEVTSLAWECRQSLEFVFDRELTAARALREELIASLNQGASAATTAAARKRAGRKRDPEVQRRNRKMVEAWSTKMYRTYKELAEAFNCSEETARKVITTAEARDRRKNA